MPDFDTHYHPPKGGFCFFGAARRIRGSRIAPATLLITVLYLASYFDTVHHRLLLKGIRKRIADQRLLALLRKFIKAISKNSKDAIAAYSRLLEKAKITIIQRERLLHKKNQSARSTYKITDNSEGMKAYNNLVTNLKMAAYLCQQLKNPSIKMLFA